MNLRIFRLHIISTVRKFLWCYNLKRKGFESFFVRNVNFAYIPNWNIHFTTYNNYKIARFYDQNINHTLMKTLRDFAIRNNVIRNKSYIKSKKTRKFFKLICTVLGDEYGKIFIINTLLRLINKKKLIL